MIIKAAKIQKNNEVLDFLLKNEKTLYDAVLSDYRRVSNNIDYRTVKELIELGRTAEAVQLLKEITRENTKDFPIALTTVFGLSGAFFIAQASLDTTFDLLRPSLVSQYASFKTSLVGSMGSDIADLTETIFYRTYADGWTADQIINELKSSVGLTGKQWEAVYRYRQLLQTNSLDALRRELRDTEEDDFVRRSLRTKEGLNKKQIDSLVASYTENFKKMRAKSIATTESTRAFSMAQNAVISQMIEDGQIEEQQVRRFWLHMGDSRVRPAHRLIPSMNPKGVPFDGYFETPLGRLKYPGDPMGVIENIINCRCVLIIKLVDEK